MNHRIATFVLAAAALAGCGTAPTSLRPMAQPASLHLQASVTWKVTNSFHDYEDLLVAGTYVAIGEADDGTYYLGPAPCLVETPGSRGKVQASAWGVIARNCGIFKPRKAAQPATVFFVQDGFWVVTDFDPDGTPRLETLSDHRDLAGRPDAAPARTVLDPGAPAMPAATAAAAGHGPMVSGVGAGIGTGLVAGIIAADLGTYHEVDPQPPAGWLEKALAAK